MPKAAISTATASQRPSLVMMVDAVESEPVISFASWLEVVTVAPETVLSISDWTVEMSPAPAAWT